MTQILILMAVYSMLVCYNINTRVTAVLLVASLCNAILWLWLDTFVFSSNYSLMLIVIVDFLTIYALMLYQGYRYERVFTILCVGVMVHLLCMVQNDFIYDNYEAIVLLLNALTVVTSYDRRRNNLHNRGRNIAVENLKDVVGL